MKDIPDVFASSTSSAATPLWLVGERDRSTWLATQDSSTDAWLQAQRFRADRHHVVTLPAAQGGPRAAVLGLGSASANEPLDLWQTAGAPDRLPPGAWAIANELDAASATAAALGWVYGGYRFDRYRSAGKSPVDLAKLVPPPRADMDYVRRAAAALAMARDMINTPAADMTPERLADEALAMATARGAAGRTVRGAALADGYPAIHAVGRAATNESCLIDFTWGDPSHPKVTLVGKGVCFDSGGLDIKAASGMALMKKDMGGAACALALARLVMDSRLPVRLRVLVPAVENAIAGNAMRPGDILRTRKGLSVEVGNTDAEGRLVLCDALADADTERPDLIVDMATLTGAARIALGPELPAIFGSRTATVDGIVRHGGRLADPLWPMPLWSGYDDEIGSKVADLNNVSPSGLAGAVIGALYLRRFVTETPDWVHIDLYAWNPKDRPGRPVGAEAQAVRAVHAYLEERYRPA
jgi:leucyl aminopeptidase